MERFRIKNVSEQGVEFTILTVKEEEIRKWLVLFMFLCNLYLFTVGGVNLEVVVLILENLNGDMWFNFLLNSHNIMKCIYQH